MHVFLTGGAGYIGAKLTGELLAAGLGVTVFDAMVYGGDALRAWIDHPRLTVVRGDVRDPGQVASAVRGCDAVVHLAAVVGEPACSCDEKAAHEINYGGTANVLEAARSAHVSRLVFLSTCSNYGVSAPGVLVNEDTPLNPLSNYARSKVEAERLLLGAAGPQAIVVLRLGTICGVAPRMRFDLLVGEMARSAVLGEPISLFSPEAWRPLLHVRDAAGAVLHCLRVPLALGIRRVYNVVGENYQKQGLADLVQRHFPEASLTVAVGKADPRDYRADGSRVTRELGFSPAHTVEEAFLETARAVRLGLFRDPLWAGHSAIPDRGELPAFPGPKEAARARAA